VHAIAFSPDGKWLASGGSDKIIRIGNAANGKQVGLLTGHTDWVPSLAFSPDGKWPASVSTDNTIMLWKAR